MNSKLDLFFTRRSIRQYTDEPIASELVQDLLEAGMAAPSAVAKDPWHFIVIRDTDQLAAVAEGLPNGQMLATASVGLVVCGDLDQAHDRLLSYLLQDCAAAIENILLAASHLGLGACWLGIHPREERMNHMRALLGIPDSQVPVSAIALGWPAETKPKRTRFKPDHVHFEHW